MQEDGLDTAAEAPIADLTGLTEADWLERLEELGEERGYFEPLGKRHCTVLSDDGPTLIVTFETSDGIRERSDSQEPLGWRLIAGHGWSNLALIAHEDSWFRDPAVYGYFDRLVDDGFFEDFDRVVFYGADMCGYAAAAFSVVAPGATVIVVQPQATLDPEVAGWDRRFPHMRRTSFTDRYGYAPEMIEGAEQVFVIYDPEQSLDAMHASLFVGSNVTRLRCRHLGSELEEKLWRMGVLPEFLDLASRGEASAARFYVAYRQARRGSMPYLRRLLGLLRNAERHRLVRMVCDLVLARMNAPRFRRARDHAIQALENAQVEDQE